MNRQELREALIGEQSALRQRYAAINKRAQRRLAYYRALPFEGAEEVGRALLDEYAAELARITQRIQEVNLELIKLSDCAGLLAAAGREIHDLYKDKYPVDSTTQVRRVHLGEGQRTLHYIIPVEHSVFDTDFLSPYVEDKRGVVQFELWADEGYPFSFSIYLAYAPEINTLFWDKGK